MKRIPKGERSKERHRMVRIQLEGRGIDDDLVLEAMRTVPRELFLPPEMREHAYADSALPIAEGQTMSQPYIVALMTQALELSSGDRVLEIGTGSGYAAAVLGYIAREVYTLERYRSLADHAEQKFEQLGIENIQVIHTDGTNGWPEACPYDGIVVTAGAPDVPDPLVHQLAVGGKLVLPVGSRATRQELFQCIKKPDGSLERKGLGPVRFVPLIGDHGWEGGLNDQPRG